MRNDELISVKQEPCSTSDDPYQSMQWELKSDAPFTTGGYNIPDMASESNLKRELLQDSKEEINAPQSSDDSPADPNTGDSSMAPIAADNTVLTESNPSQPAGSENNRTYKVSLKRQGRRPHQCKTCNIFFSTLENFHIHMRTHKSSESKRR